MERKASGQIIVYNAYNDNNQKLIKNTRFETPDGKIYRIQASIIVPGTKVEEGKISSILAPKGSGKSTLLKIISGLEAEAGDNFLNRDKMIAYIPSRASSFPWLDYPENAVRKFEWLLLF